MTHTLSRYVLLLIVGLAASFAGLGVAQDDAARTTTSTAEILWRRTAAGWERSDLWANERRSPGDVVAPRPHAVPHPLLVSAAMAVLSISALLLSPHPGPHIYRGPDRRRARGRANSGASPVSVPRLL